MTYDSKLYTAISGLGLHIESNMDTSTDSEYCAYYYDREALNKSCSFCPYASY